MTITLILPQPPGYSETFFRSKIQGLQESGHEVILVTAATETIFEACKHLKHPKVSKNNLVQVFKMLIVFIGLLPYIKRLIKFIQLERKEESGFKKILEKIYINATLLKIKTDWLHFGFATMAVDRELVAKAIGAKLAVSLRGYDMDVYPLKQKNCYSLLWKQVDKVHSISKYLFHKAYGLGLSPHLDYEIITPAVDFERLKSLPKHQAESSGKLKLLTIARLHWIKGIDDLIETASYLKEKNIDFEWSIIGEGDIKHTERYLHHVYQKKLKDHIRFLGKQTHQETLNYLSESDVYVQTSLSEGFCNAVLEAQALGQVCIAFDSGALKENIVHNQTGLLVPKAQPKLLAEKIWEVIQLNEEDKRKIQEKAIKRVQNQFTLKQQKEKFNAFYNYR
ncbi:glycosyltransferase family 4 protein [Psychroflexus montanilacus]|uniref:glycosyltransferase family 4 protein n=1 Tax=Psychroflexus montanilacus TaxID=2873598 RepID=UPI001CC9A476|nr:glycosyltransferase family 4 protein [Psychroflexus montanilacus]MBZ9652096.1 glycosyltransferase family 4 protein [Psychroflexus montanilacus]